jgi:flagellar biogenesis protein FliO
MSISVAAVLMHWALAASLGDDVPAIEKATATVDDGRLIAEVTTSLPIFREDLRAKVDGRNVVLYVQGAAINGPKRVFGEGPQAVRAYARSSYVKLEMPLPAGVSCGGPATISVADDTIHMSMACKGAGVAAAAAAPKAEAAAPAAEIAAAERAIEAAKAIEPKAEPKAARDILQERAAVAPKTAETVKTRSLTKAEAEAPTPTKIWAAAPAAAAAEAKTTETAKTEVAKTEVAKAAEPAVAAATHAAEKPAALPTQAEAPKAEVKPIVAVPAREEKRTTAENAAPQPADSNSGVMVGAALLLLAGAAFYLHRRRKQQQAGLIRILETASLGPKRTLVVAEVDGEKMILGTSEAGISVLTPAGRAASPWGEQTMSSRVHLPADMLTGQTMVQGHPALAMATTSTAIPAYAAATAMAHAPKTVAEPEIHIETDENEGGLLSRLFRRNAATIESDEGLGNMEEEFRDLLQDSIEDEELRRRLQAGLGGRTS